MTFNVHVTEFAKANVGEIVTWLQERSPAGANAWFHAWAATLVKLAERAESCGHAPESAAHSEPIRQIFFKTRRGRMYRALFTIREHDVYILHVR